MKLDRLDQNVRRYYHDQKLSAETLERLKQKIETHQQKPRMPYRHFAAAMAAVVVLVLASALVLEMREVPDHQIVREISEQAAIAHNQKLDMEFVADDYQDLRISMDRLGFEPVSPVRFAGKNMKVLGARYGSIHGQPAVQISLLDPQGEICTLYQARPVGELARLTNEASEIDGLIVELWQEKGLLMVLARPAA